MDGWMDGIRVVLAFVGECKCHSQSDTLSVLGRGEDGL